MAENSAYSILELAENVSKEEIKSAFKKLSLQYHPDKNNGNEESTKKFIEIRAAYEAIMDDLDGKKKSDNFTHDYQDEDNFWNADFASEDFKKFKAKFSENLNKQGFMNSKIEAYSLLEEREFFTTKAKATYIAVRDCESLIEFKGNKSLKGEELIAALKGAVASHDLNKFFDIVTYIHSSKISDHVVGLYIIFDVIEAVLSEAELSKIEEDKLSIMIKYLLEEKNIAANDSAVKQAAEAGFYATAEYLINHGSNIGNLSIFNLFNDEGKDNFEAFKWLKDHGAKVKESTIEEIVCHYKLLYKMPALENYTNIELVKDFFIKENIASLETITRAEWYCRYGGRLKALFSEAKLSKIEEDKLITRIKYLVENNIVSKDSADSAVKQAVEEGFYDTAQYLFDNGRNIKELSLSPFDLFNDEGKDNFEAFKWLKDRGIKVEKATVTHVVCHNHVKLRYMPVLENYANIELAKNFFIRENIASLEEINNIEQECNLFVNFLGSAVYDRTKLLNIEIQYNEIFNVKFMLDHGAKPDDNSFNAMEDDVSLEMFELVTAQIYYSPNVIKKGILGKYIESNSIEKLKTLFDEGLGLDKSAYLELHHATIEMAELILNQMRSQELEYEGSKVFDEINLVENTYCEKYVYNINTPQDCQLSKLVANYLGETEQVDWSVCQ